MSGWDELEDELDLWGRAGRTATFWWRDDDATRPGPLLASTLAAAREVGAPLALAVVPAAATLALAEVVTSREEVWVLQHGYAHRNHEPGDARKSEYGPSRRPDDALAELGIGWERLRTLFGARALAVLVPPWNRIDPTIAARLAGAGYAGLSTFKPRRADGPGPGLRRANTHIDPVDWRGDRGFRGEAAVLDAAIRHLRDRRAGHTTADEPTGLLTHHAIGDARILDFASRLGAVVAAHPAARWVSPTDLFGG